MARSVRWQVPFMSLDNKKYRVDIYQENFNGTVEVLKGAATPFYTQEDDDEDAFLPIRTSSGYLTVICENASLVNEILPVDVHDRYVELVDATNANSEVVKWNGYILPSEFSGEWDTTPYELQLPIASPIAACQDLRYQGFFKAVTIGDVLRKILQDHLKVETPFIMSGKFAAQTASMLTAVFSDIQFAESDTPEESPAFGTGSNVSIDEEYSTVGDVLEAICKLYGYVIHETPSALWFCSSDMDTVYYQTEIDYDPNDDYLQSETEINLSDVDLPDIAGSDHSRSILPGKSKVRVYCEAQEIGEMWNADFEELEQVDSSFYKYPNNSLFGEDDGFFCYTRHDSQRKSCIQYLESDYDRLDPHPIYNTSVFNANRIADARNLIGANFFSIAQWKKPNYIWPDEFDKYTNGILICQPEHYYNGHDVCLMRIQSKKSYSAMNFLRNGIILSCKCQASKGWDKLDFKYKYDKNSFRILIKWGDKYYISGVPQSGDHISYGHWSITPGEPGTFDDNIFFVLLDSYDSNQDEGESELFKVNPSQLDELDFFRQNVWDIRNAKKIRLREDEVRDINGQITIELWSWENTSNLKYQLLYDFHLDHVPFSYESLGDNTNHYLSDFRRQLSNTEAEDYEYKMPLNNMMADYSPSGVVPPATVQDTPADYFEQTILSRLSDWYDRTIEQLSVTVEHSDLMPGQRIEYGNSLYIVVARADNWRDNEMTLTLQKMYEQS